jgi:hypothetical protein
MSGLDVLGARVVLRDRAVSDVFDLAIRFIAVEGATYAKVALGSVVPGALATIAAGLAVGWWVALAVGVLAASVAETAFTLLASRLVFREGVRAGDILRAAASDAPRVLVARSLALLAALLGLLAFFIVGVWARAVFLFVPEVMLLERASLGQAFARAQRVASVALSDVLVGGCLLALVPLGSILLADVAGRAVIADLLQFTAPPPIWVSHGSVLGALGLFAAVPYVATARFLLYLNVRTRTEGWDIQTRFHAIAARDAA